MGSSGATIGCIPKSANTMGVIATGLKRRAVAPGDPSQSSLSLDSLVISTGFLRDGQDNITSPGQSLFLILSSSLKIWRELISPNLAPSNTSSNNWINFCLTVDKPLTNGSQVAGTPAVLTHRLGTLG